MNNCRFVVIALAFGLTSISIPKLGAAEIIWSNGPAYQVAFPGDGWVSTLNPGYPFEGQAADDFRPTQGPGGESLWQLTDLKWYGTPISFANGDEFGFNVLIYGEAPGGGKPTGGPGDPTQTALFTAHFGFDEIVVVPGQFPGQGYFEAALDTPYLLESDRTYWLTIQAAGDNDERWFWRRSTQAQLNDVHIGSTTLAIPYWRDITPFFPFPVGPFDVAFELRGTPVPEPGSASLVMVALGAMLLRRRWRSKSGA